MHLLRSEIVDARFELLVGHVIAGDAGNEVNVQLGQDKWVIPIDSRMVLFFGEASIVVLNDCRD